MSRFTLRLLLPHHVESERIYKFQSNLAVPFRAVMFAQFLISRTACLELNYSSNYRRSFPSSFKGNNFLISEHLINVYLGIVIEKNNFFLFSSVLERADVLEQIILNNLVRGKYC